MRVAWLRVGSAPSCVASSHRWCSSPRPRGAASPARPSPCARPGKRSCAAPWATAAAAHRARLRRLDRCRHWIRFGDGFDGGACSAEHIEAEHVPGQRLLLRQLLLLLVGLLGLDRSLKFLCELIRFVDLPIGRATPEDCIGRGGRARTQGCCEAPPPRVCVCRRWTNAFCRAWSARLAFHNCAPLRCRWASVGRIRRLAHFDDAHHPLRGHRLSCGVHGGAGGSRG